MQKKNAAMNDKCCDEYMHKTCGSSWIKSFRVFCLPKEKFHVKWLLSKSQQDLSVKPFGDVSEGQKPVKEIPDRRASMNQ